MATLGSLFDGIAGFPLSSPSRYAPDERWQQFWAKEEHRKKGLVYRWFGI